MTGIPALGPHLEGGIAKMAADTTVNLAIAIASLAPDAAIAHGTDLSSYASGFDSGFHRALLMYMT